MKLADGIHKHGFRKWYERELLRSHAHMVLAFLCMVGAFAGFELIAEGRNRLGNAFMIIVCAVLGAWAVRRYVRLLSSAEAVANQADCPGCGTYARFTLVGHDAPSGDVRVHCRQCQREWDINAF